MKYFSKNEKEICKLVPRDDGTFSRVRSCLENLIVVIGLAHLDVVDANLVPLGTFPHDLLALDVVHLARSLIDLVQVAFVQILPQDLSDLVVTRFVGQSAADVTEVTTGDFFRMHESQVRAFILSFFYA